MISLLIWIRWYQNIVDYQESYINYMYILQSQIMLSTRKPQFIINCLSLAYKCIFSLVNPIFQDNLKNLFGVYYPKVDMIYRQIYLYDIKKQIDNRAYGQLFCPVSRRVQCVLYLPIMYVYCIHPEMSKITK